MFLRALRVPIGWKALLKRTYEEVLSDNCFGLAAQLAYYFFLALFPALLFLVALISLFPVQSLLDTITSVLARVAPGEVIKIVQDQIIAIAHEEKGGLLTLGMLGTIWSTSAGVSAIIDALNQAYDIRERRPWWRVRLVALGLTMALAAFILVSSTLVVAGPSIAETVARWFGLGQTFTWTWTILQWPVVFLLVSFAISTVYFLAPDAKQEWIWITPGSLAATFLWLVSSLGFKIYLANFGSYNATYGTLGGVIVLLLWFYVSGFAILVGAELNAEIEHASPHGKDPGQRVPGERKAIGPLAARMWQEGKRTGTFRRALSAANCEVDRDLPPAAAPRREPPRPSDWVLSAVALTPVAFRTYRKVRGLLK
jgi:membrane protein